MPTMLNSTISELQYLLNQSELSSTTRIRIIVDDDNHVIELLKRKKAIDAMNKLRGSGNGNLLNVLLTEREKDKQK